MGQTSYNQQIPAHTEHQATSASRFQGTGLAGQPHVPQDTHTAPATHIRQLELAKNDVRTHTRARTDVQTSKSPHTPRPLLVAERKAPPPPKPSVPVPQLPSEAKGTVPKSEVTPPAKPVEASTPAVPASTSAARPAERRISSMNEAQIMDKLRSVVSPANPEEMYRKIKKVGQGCVIVSAAS